MQRFVTKDFLSGLMFVVFGLTALYFGQNLAIGTTVRMGPGYVPRMLSLILLALGALVCIVALVSGSEPVERPKWKPITLITIGIVCFALLFERAGLVMQVAAFGVLGYIFVRLGCEGAPFLLGLVLGPQMEEYFRRAMLLSRGDAMVFLERPISLGLLITTTLLLILMALPSIKKARQEAFQEEG